MSKQIVVVTVPDSEEVVYSSNEADVFEVDVHSVLRIRQGDELVAVYNAMGWLNVYSQLEPAADDGEARE